MITDIRAEISAAEKILRSLIAFAVKNDVYPLPRCFDFCAMILRNIEICRNNAWQDIDVLCRIMAEDWKSAMHCRAGLPEYYIHKDDAQLRQSLNRTLAEYITEADRCIMKIEKQGRGK